jgi:hypothetical protein
MAFFRFILIVSQKSRKWPLFVILAKARIPLFKIQGPIDWDILLTELPLELTDGFIYVASHGPAHLTRQVHVE